MEKTPEFDKWLRKLNDLVAKANILFRLQKLERDEHFGDCEPVGDGIKELKINYAKGYRVYADYLDNKKMIAQYLNTVLEEGSEDQIITAIGHIAKAIGMSKIAEETGMSRPSLYKALSEGARPQFSTIVKVLNAVGAELKVKPKRA